MIVHQSKSNSLETMTESKQMSAYMNTKSVDPQAISLYFDDNAFSTVDIVCNDTVQSRQPGGENPFSRHT